MRERRLLFESRGGVEHGVMPNRKPTKYAKIRTSGNLRLPSRELTMKRRRNLRKHPEWALPGERREG